MQHSSNELDSARAILTTYQQIHDDTTQQRKLARLKLQQKNKQLLSELCLLKQKYSILKKELMNREERLNRLNRQLIDKTAHMVRLQEDYENAIYQLTKD